MAFMNQERKKELTPWIKNVLDKYGMKASLGVRQNASLVCNLKSWPINFISYLSERANKEGINTNSDIRINEYHIESQFEWVAKDFLLELRAAMMLWNHDNSDIMTDYFYVGWYIDINLGTDDKEYIIT